MTKIMKPKTIPSSNTVEDLILKDQELIQEAKDCNSVYGAMVIVARKYPEIEYNTERAHEVMKKIGHIGVHALRQGNFHSVYDYHEFLGFWGQDYTRRIIIGKILKAGDKVIFDFKTMSSAWQPKKKSGQTGTVQDGSFFGDTVYVKYENDDSKYSFPTEKIVSINGNKDIEALVAKWINDNSHITQQRGKT